MRIRTFIMAASAVVSIVFFGGSYFAIGRIFDHSVKENAIQASETLAHLTFNAMYQVMSTGWKRRQLDAFIAATNEATRDTPTTIRIFRGRPVVADYGEIEQPPLDDMLARVLETGVPQSLAGERDVRHVFPLKANERCLRCHEKAEVGTVLGAIEVRQDFTPMVEKARREFLLLLGALAPLAMLVAGIVVWRVNRRIEQSLEVVDASIAKVNAVADLKQLQFARHNLGFDELNRLFARLGELVDKLRSVAVDKDVLRFEIGLLEKFVITSDVVRDWREYIARLLADINQVVTTHVLFSIFEVGDELFDLEVFWRARPARETREMVEGHLRRMLADDPRFAGFTTVNFHHHEGRPDEDELVLDEREVVLHTKTFTVDRPKIGGIVGVGVNAEVMEDETLRLVMDSVLSTLLNVVGSIKAIYKYTQDMEYYATRDPLTDLFNRRIFWDLLGYEIARAQRHGYPFTLLVIDLDNFKLVNDGFGHPVGDLYLQEFSDAVKRVLRLGDIFARYGGDEFALIIPEADLAQGTAVAERVLQAIEQMEIETPDGVRVRGTASIGLAAYPLHAEDPKDLFLFADNMMYKAKSGGKHRIGVPGEEDIAEVFRDMTEMNVLVLNAVNERRVVPFFQPILDLGCDKIMGYEVLSRIASDGKYVPAQSFIEFAEKAGVIHRLDSQVMEQALETLGQSEFDGHIFINLSPRALVLSDFARTVRAVVGGSGIAPERIVFEITERDTVKNVGMLERFLNDLKFEGFKLAIDDFGSGFSSFHYLRRFSIDFLKLEGDFVVNMLESQKDHAFVQTIHALATELKIGVIAEHVENPSVLAELRRMGVGFAQGRYIGSPQAKFLNDRRWAPREALAAFDPQP